MMRRPSHTPDVVRAVIAPAKATKRRPINPKYSTETTKKLQSNNSGAFLYGDERQHINSPKTN